MFSRNELLAISNGFIVNINGISLNKKGEEVGSIGSNGYRYISIRNKNRITKVMVHRLQAYQKFGNKIYEEGVVVRHLDGNKLNNSYANIEIGTSIDNSLDKPKEVRLQASKKASSYITKYTIELINKIKADRLMGLTYNELAIKYRICNKGHVYYLLHKRK